MNNEMPVMPGVDDKISLPGEKEEATKSENLEVASSSEEKVIINEPDKDVSNKVNVPLTSIKGYEVIATRKGFFGQLRVRSGDEFTVKTFEELGDWMKCKDPAAERERVKFFKSKKANK